MPPTRHHGGEDGGRREYLLSGQVWISLHCRAELTPESRIRHLLQRCALVLIPWFGDWVFPEREAVRESQRSPRQPPPASRINLYEHCYRGRTLGYSHRSS